jgi:ABC transport system ATP-binding/permease protein
MPTARELPTTAPLDIASPSARAEAALLDCHTRSLAIRPALARPGSYLALDGGETSLLVPLKCGVTHIGRGLSADIRVEEQRVSRRHALIIRGRNGVLLLDDRSAPGTFVNGRRVEHAELRDNDTIALGPVTFRYVEIVHKPHRDAHREHTRRSQRAMDGWVSSRARARVRARDRSRVAAAPRV